jgi:enoyl-CoA hydratase/carnithine racemase
MTVAYEVRDDIAFISFNRPEKHNALRDEDLQALIDALRRLDHDPAASIGILFGQGRSFSSGGDVDARLQASMDAGSTADRTNEAEAFLECEHWKPVIAAVHGYCLGHALNTALQCDLIVADRSARFQVTEILVGLPMPTLLPRLGHAAFANEVALTGRMFGAHEAWQAGMLTRLVDVGEHLRAAEELARLILANPQPAVREHVRVRRRLAREASAPAQALTAPFLAGWATDADARDAVAARAAGDRRHA